MKYFEWSQEKNKSLQLERNISFEVIVFNIEEGKLLDILEHPDQIKYAGQKLFVIDINNYAYLVPFVENEKTVFLKTIIPSRKATKKYLKRDL